MAAAAAAAAAGSAAGSVAPGVAPPPDMEAANAVMCVRTSISLLFVVSSIPAVSPARDPVVPVAVRMAVAGDVRPAVVPAGLTMADLRPGLLDRQKRQLFALLVVPAGLEQ